MRGPLWWLREHAEAERAVTMAWELDGGPMTGAWFDRMMDARVDHLEKVDAACDRFIEELAEVASQELADDVRAVYAMGESLQDVARRQGMRSNTLYDMVKRAAGRLPVPYPVE